MSVKDWDESDEKVEFDKAEAAKAAEEAAAAEKEDAMSEDEKEEVSLVDGRAGGCAFGRLRASSSSPHLRITRTCTRLCTRTPACTPRTR